MKLTGADIRAIAVETANVIEYRQRMASRELSKRLKGWTPTKDTLKPKQSEGRPSTAIRKAMRPYYKTASHNGLPAGVSVVTNMVTPAWKASFRQEHLGTFHNVQDAIDARKKAEMRFDS